MKLLSTLALIIAIIPLGNGAYVMLDQNGKPVANCMMVQGGQLVCGLEFR